MNSPVNIRLCRHILPDGRHCRGAAVGGRACCRHHIDARARLHNMARAARCSCISRVRVPETPLDLLYNEAEARRLIATGRIDFDTARMMMWALRLSASTFAARSACAFRSDNSNVFYQVPATPVFSKGYTQSPAKVLENTGQREGVPTRSPRGRREEGSVGC